MRPQPCAISEEETNVKTLDEVSAALKTRRCAMGYTLDDVCRVLRVKANYVRAMEENEWDSLSHLYLVGYVGSYARLLHLDAGDLLKPVRLLQAGNDNLAVKEYKVGRVALADKKYPSRSRSVPRVSLALFIVPALLALAYWGYNLAFSPDKAPSPEKASAPGKEEAPSPEENASARHYLIHAEEYATLRVYDKRGNLRKEMPLSAGEAYFLTVPAGGYVKASGNADHVEVYTRDMKKRLGTVAILSSERK